MKKYAILCSGGDCQGMNACIKAFVNTCNAHGSKVLGVLRGYQGLIDNEFIDLKDETVENIANIGGTIIKTSRSDEFKTQPGFKKALRNLKKHNIDSLVILGGDGSFKGAAELHDNGIKVVCIPATIDNDLFYTDNTLGFDTAVMNAVSAIDNLKQTMSSTDRAMIIELMGRNCGDIALYTALVIGADSLALSEVDTKIKDIIQDLSLSAERGCKSPIVIMSEALDYSIKDVEKAIQKHLGIDVRGSELGYIQRGGAPSLLDRMLAVEFAIRAFMLLSEGKSGMALGVDDNFVFDIPIAEANNAPKRFRTDLLNKLYILKNKTHYTDKNKDKKGK